MPYMYAGSKREAFAVGSGGLKVFCMVCATVKVILECNSYGNIVALNRNSTYEDLVALACSTWNFLNLLEVVLNYLCSEFLTVKILLTNEEQMKDALEVLFHNTSRMKIFVTSSPKSTN